MSVPLVDEEAVKTGFPITCASCEHFRKAHQTDADDCGKLLTCGGPIFGRAFPDYEGPFIPQVFEKICLICGTQNIDFHVLAGLRRFGLCFKHRGVFSKPLGQGTQVPVVVKIPGRLS